jgi:glycosyltransferase involved in cell wall biosynthesis
MKFKSAKLFGWYQLKKPEKYIGPIQERSASIIIPFGSVDYLKPLSNCLRSVRWQEFVNHDDIEVILVYLHREPEDHRAKEKECLDKMIEQYNTVMIDVHKPHDHFPLCLARNIGARAAKGDILFFIDADAVLDPEFFARTLRAFNDEVFVTCWFSYLSKGYGSPVYAQKKIMRELALTGQVRKGAYGGGIVAPRNVVHEIRGFDEVYDRAWGADDNDMVDRLIEYGLEWYNVSKEENIVNLHQWHPNRQDEKNPGTIANRERYYSLETIIRNDDGWGSASPSASTISMDKSSLEAPMDASSASPSASPSTDPGFEV